ncbi:hypothetical protein [Nocardia transvalensis]|uniref:hypothetical protein n=1 Tax=Nocardia transvalensis TaxID=37333 RepID=UPI0018930E4A|nr:hypothetical protein [Nocardia transvalensis]MBF6329981.1 hypothetical protein [Nocardia transvalensis]
MTARSELEQELHGPLAASDQLTEQEIADLLMLFRAARREEAQALDRSIDAMIGALPRPLRAVTKKIMFGDRLDR